MEVLSGIIGQVEVSDLVAWGMSIIAALAGAVCFLYEMQRRSTAKHIEYLQEQLEKRDKQLRELTEH